MESKPPNFKIAGSKKKLVRMEHPAGKRGSGQHRRKPGGGGAQPGTPKRPPKFKSITKMPKPRP